MPSWVLRTICSLLLACAPLAAETTPPAKPPDPPRPFQLPFLFDGVYQMRVHEERGWHGFDAMFRLRPDLWFDDPGLRHHQVVVAGLWETGFHMDPNPTRFAIMTGYAWGMDYVHPKAQDDHFISLSDEGELPLTRSTFFSYGMQMMVGFHSSRGTRQPNGRLESQDSIRLEHRVYAGALWFEFMGAAALHLNLRDGRFLEGEIFVGFEMCRPIAPFGIRVGYSYLFFERGGLAHFVFGLRVAF
jgi:hypothetical protein